MYLEDVVHTVGVNLAGLPAASVPAGLARLTAPASTGNAVELPVGLQIIASRFDEATMLRVALAFRTRDRVVAHETAGA